MLTRPSRQFESTRPITPWNICLIYTYIRFMIPMNRWHKAAGRVYAKMQLSRPWNDLSLLGTSIHLHSLVGSIHCMIQMNRWHKSGKMQLSCPWQLTLKLLRGSSNVSLLSHSLIRNDICSYRLSAQGADLVHTILAIMPTLSITFIFYKDFFFHPKGPNAHLVLPYYLAIKLWRQHFRLTPCKVVL